MNLIKNCFIMVVKLLLKLGKEEPAENYFREALALDPGYTEAALTLNKLFLQKEQYKQCY